MASNPNFKFPELTDNVRALAMGDASAPDATPELIARERAIHTGLAQDLPADYAAEAPFYRATLAASPTGIAEAKRWGQSLKSGASTPEAVAASRGGEIQL